MDIWGRVKQDDLNRSRSEEIKEIEKKKLATSKFIKKIEETRQNGEDIMNFCPHLQD